MLLACLLYHVLCYLCWWQARYQHCQGSHADFIKYLGREGLCKVDETEKGWYISLIQRDQAEELAAERRAKRERAEAV